jgi:hypothetical protein
VASQPSSAFSQAGPCQPARGGAPRRGHHAQCDRGGAAPTGGMDDEVRGGGRFELVKSKGEAPDMEERGGISPRWRDTGGVASSDGDSGVSSMVVCSGGRLRQWKAPAAPEG